MNSQCIHEVENICNDKKILDPEKIKRIKKVISQPKVEDVSRKKRKGELEALKQLGKRY